jgi:hypothetical protein
MILKSKGLVKDKMTLWIIIINTANSLENKISRHKHQDGVKMAVPTGN